jgi:hypothetical protein
MLSIKTQVYQIVRKKDNKVIFDTDFSKVTFRGHTVGLFCSLIGLFVLNRSLDMDFSKVTFRGHTVLSERRESERESACARERERERERKRERGPAWREDGRARERERERKRERESIEWC